MKNFLDGTVYLDTKKTTDSEEELFYQLQDRFNGIIHAKKLVVPILNNILSSIFHLLRKIHLSRR